MRFLKSVRIAMMATLLSLTGLVAFPASAQASSSCPGTRIEHLAVGSAGTLDVYYSTAAGGTNCAVLFSSHTSYQKFMLLKLYRCTVSAGGYCGSPTSSTYDASNSDSGNYFSYAGAISVTGTAARCIAWAAEIDDPGANYAPGSNVATHCG